MRRNQRPKYGYYVDHVVDVFGAVGSLGVSVQLSMLALLKGFLGVYYLAATVVAVEIAILHNSFWHERWTWGDRGLFGAPGGSPDSLVSTPRRG